jgi:hypothetical protein
LDSVRNDGKEEEEEEEEKHEERKEIKVMDGADLYILSELGIQSALS